MTPEDREALRRLANDLGPILRTFHASRWDMEHYDFARNAPLVILDLLDAADALETATRLQNENAVTAVQENERANRAEAALATLQAEYEALKRDCDAKVR